MTAAPTKPSTLAIHSILFAVQMAFATLSVVGKIAMRETTTPTIAFVRLLGTAIVVSTWRILSDGWPRLPVRDIARLALIAPLGIVINQLLFLGGVARTSALNGTVLTTTVPIFVVIFAFMLGRERLHAFLVSGVLLASLGIAVCVGGDKLQLNRSALVGDAMILGNAASYGLYLIFVRDIIQRHGPWNVMPYVIVFGLLAISPFGLPSFLVEARTASATTWIALAWLVCVPTIFTYLANGWALLHAPASLVAVYICLQPLGTAFLGATLLDEPITPAVILGGVLVSLGIILVQRVPRDVVARPQIGAP